MIWRIKSWFGYKASVLHAGYTLYLMGWTWRPWYYRYPVRCPKTQTWFTVWSGLEQ